MGEVIQFIPKAEREQIRLIREARAIYDGVFPPSNSGNEQSTPMVLSVNGAKVHQGSEVLS